MASLTASFAIPMRNYFVLRLKLTFPTPTATAFAIRALHAGKSGAEAAKQKGRWLFWSFLPAFVQKVASTYAPGILYDIHIFYDIATWGGRTAQYVDNWGWCVRVRVDRADFSGTSRSRPRSSAPASSRA